VIKAELIIKNLQPWVDEKLKKPMVLNKRAVGLIPSALLFFLDTPCHVPDQLVA
jgi:hypothetical protein